MAVCIPNDLLAENPCYAALQPYEQEVVLTQLLCNLLDKIENAGEVTCDISTLLEQGKCFAAMPSFILKTLQVQLLCDISNALP